jgi:hypothetical protein
MLRKFIREQIEKRFSEAYKSAKANHKLSIELFSEIIAEGQDENKKQDVLNKIKDNDYEKQNPLSYYNAINKSKHKGMLTDYSVNDFSKMKLFKLNGYNIGFALKKKDGRYSEIVAVFNNEPEVGGIGKDLMKSAIANGGCYLDHFDGFLSNLYEPLGFVEYDRIPFDPQYDEDGSFQSKYGKADVIFRAHKSCKIPTF